MDSISSLNNSIDTATLLGIAQQQGNQAIEGVTAQSSQTGDSVTALSSTDEATISAEAKAAYQKDQLIQSFSRLVPQTLDSTNADQIAQLKAQFESGNIGSYLDSINLNTLAGNMLSSPVGSILQSADIA